MQENGFDRQPIETIRTIDVNGLKITDSTYGVGPIHILSLHGWTNDGRKTIIPMTKNLPYNKYTIHTLDLPGFGESQTPNSEWSLNDYCDFVVQYLHKLNYNDTTPINIIGHSFGGRIAIRLAAYRHDLVNKIVLIDSAGVTNKQNHIKKLRLKTYKQTRNILEGIKMNKASENLRNWYNNRYGSDDLKNSTGAMRGTFLKVINENSENYANQVECETLILWGAEDQVTPAWQAKRLTQLIPNSGLFVWPNAGHYSHLDEPYRTAKAIDLFLNPNNQS